MSRFLLLSLLLAACLRLSAAQGGLTSSSALPSESSSTGQSWYGLSSSSYYPALSSSSAAPASSSSSGTAAPPEPIVSFYSPGDATFTPLYAFNYTLLQAYAAYNPSASTTLTLTPDVSFQYDPPAALTSSYVFVTYAVAAAPKYAGQGVLSCGGSASAVAGQAAYNQSTYDQNAVAQFVDGCTYSYNENAVPVAFLGSIPLWTVYVYLLDQASAGYAQYAATGDYSLLQGAAVATTQLEFDMYIQQQPVAIASVSGQLSVGAGNSTQLAALLKLAASVTDSINLTASVDIGTLSATSFAGVIGVLVSDIAAWTYTAPLVTPPSAYYAYDTTNPHYIGMQYNVAVAFLTLSLASPSAGTSTFAFPILIRLVNQPPTIAVDAPALFANLSVQAGGTLALDVLANLTYADVDGYNFTELLAVSALGGGKVCFYNQVSAAQQCAGYFSEPAGLHFLNSYKPFGLSYTAPLLSNGTVYIQVSLTDSYQASGVAGLTATYTFPITVTPLTLPTAPVVSVAAPNVLQLNATALSATWPSYSDANIANPIVSYYTVSYGSVSGGGAALGAFNVSAVKGAVVYNASIGGLQPATLYWITVAAGNTIGLSAPSTYSAAAAGSVYPVQSTTCGPTQYCGVQWTQAVTQPAPSLSVQGNGYSAYYLYVYVAPTANLLSTVAYYNVSYAAVGAKGAIGNATTVQLYSPSGYAYTALTGLAPSTTYVVSVVLYDTLFNVASLPTNVTYTTLAAAPSVLALSVSDPNVTATATNFLYYRTGLLLSLQFSAAIQLGLSPSVDPSQFAYSVPVGALSAWSQTAPNAISAWVVDATKAGNVQLGAFTVFVSAYANVTAVSPYSYPVNASSPALTGSFGNYSFGAAALSVATTPFTTNATVVPLASLVAFTGTGGNYSYSLSLVSPGVATLQSSAVNSLSGNTSFTFGASGSAVVGGSLAALQASVAGLSIVLPAYYSGPVSYSVNGYSSINGSYLVTSSALGQVTVTAVYHAPQILYNGTSTTFTVPVSSAPVPLASYVTGLAIYDVDADSSKNAYANTAALYSLSVSWSTLAPASFLSSSAAAVVVPSGGSSAANSTQAGSSSFASSGTLAQLQAALASLYLTSFSFDPTLAPSTLNVTVANAQSQSSSASFTLLQATASVPATAVTALYLLPNQQSFVALLADSVYTSLALAASPAKFNASDLFASTGFGASAKCRFLGGSPITAYTAVAAAGAYIQCGLGTGAGFTLDQTNNVLTPALSTVTGTYALQRVNGGQTAQGNSTLSIQLLPVGSGSLASVYGTPSFTLSGSATISFCPNQSAAITSIVSSAGIGSGTKYAWVVSPATDATQLLNSALLAGGVVLSMPSLNIANVDAFSFFKAGTLVFQLTVTNLVGVPYTQQLSVTRQTTPAPLLVGPGTQINSLTDLILLSFTPQLPGACFTNSSGIVYTWAAAGNTVTLDPSTVHSATLGFVAPYLKSGLQYGQTYSFVLTASLAGVANSNVSASVALYINDLPLVAGIAGPGMFQMGNTAAWSLTTVGATQLPKQALSVTYQWTCADASGAACPGVVDSGLPTLAVPILPAGNSYTFSCLIQAYFANAPVQFGSASVTASVVDGSPVAITITAYKGTALQQGSVVVNDFSSLRLAASASAKSATYQWSCVGCPASFVLNANASNSAALSLNPTNAAGFWTALATYWFRVDVTPINSSQVASYSAIVVTVNTPPTAPSTEALLITGPGDISGAPLGGYANGVDQWTLSVAQVETGQSGWTGSGLLTYQFYYVDALGGINYLTSVSPALSVTTPLPLGYGAGSTLPIGVVVYDGNGGQSNYQPTGATTAVVNLPTNVSPLQLLDSLLSSVTNLSPSNFMAAVISLASTATALGASSGADPNSAAALQQRAQLLSAVSSNLASVSPVQAMQALSSIVGGGAVSDPATLRLGAAVLSAVLLRAITDPAFTSTPVQLGSFFITTTGLMKSNHQSTTQGRRLLQVSSGEQEQTQQSTDALYAQAMGAISTAFIGDAAAPAVQVVPNAGAFVARAAYAEGVTTPASVASTNGTVSLSAGADWLLNNTVDDTSNFDVQVGVISPDPLLSLTDVTAAFSGVTVWFDVVAAGTNVSQPLVFANITDAPALGFNVNDVPAVAALIAAGHYVQCVQWNYTAGYVPVGTSALDSTGAFSCQPATAHTYVSYAAVSPVSAPHPSLSSSSSGASGGGAQLSSSSSTGPVNTNQFAYLFSGYSGSRSEGGYYFWMAVSIALCLLFPAFVLTFKPVSYSAAHAKNKALQEDAIPAVTKPTQQPAQQKQQAVSHKLTVGPRTSVFVPGEQKIMPTSQASPKVTAAEAAEYKERERGATEDGGTLDYGDVNALKRNVYNNADEQEQKDESEEANSDEVGFVIHQ